MINVNKLLPFVVIKPNINNQKIIKSSITFMLSVITKSSTIKLIMILLSTPFTFFSLALLAPEKNKFNKAWGA